MNQTNKLKKRKAKSPTPPVDPSVGASTSATASGDSSGITTEDVLQNTSTLLEVLKSVSEAAEILGPLKAVCGVLKIAVDAAILLQSNGEDLKDLIEKLEPQQRFIESEIVKLSKPEFGKVEHVQDLVEPLWRYLLALKNMHEKLDTLKSKYDGGKVKRVKRMLMAQSDKDEITSITQKLEDSFWYFMNCVTNFIARQTLLMHREIEELRTQIAEKDAKDALSKLVYVNARGNQHETCAEGTRMNMLDVIARWANDRNAEPVFALVDQAGTGKSTIAAHMTQEWEKEGSLLARFFFSKPSTVTANGLASTLAKDLAKNVPSLRSLVLAAIEEHDDFSSCPLHQQLEWLVFTPLRSLKEPRVMVIDALDECSKADRGIFLKSLLNFLTSFDAGTCPPKVLLTGRPQDDIVSRIQELRFAKSIRCITFLLHSKDSDSNEADIRLYLTRLLGNCLTPEQLDLLVVRANGLFIWASTAQQLILNAFDPSELFTTLIQKDSSLDSLYGEVLGSALQRAGGKQEEVLKKVLQAICVAREPLTAEMIDEVLGLANGVAQRVVKSLSSVLSDGSHGQGIYALHPTFLEYLQDTSKDPPIVSSQEAEALMAIGCLKVLSQGLKYNIAGIALPGVHQRNINLMGGREEEKILQQQLRKNTTPTLRYAAFYGISHIASSVHAVEVIQDLRKFLQSKLLHWIELMGWYQEVRTLMGSVHDLKTCIEATLSSINLLSVNDVQWCKDVLGMVQPFQATIEESPMQVYFSALAFEPSTSNIACWYHSHFAESIPRVVLGTRNAQSQSLVLTGHDKDVNAVAFSPDGRRLASASDDHTVRLWDPSTGAAIAELVGHTCAVAAISFSPDGRYLLSASFDETVKVWDASTGAAVRTLAGHNVDVTCIAFSINGQQLASGHEDGSVRVLDLGTGAVVCTLSGHTEIVRCLAFSHKGQQLASGSKDRTVRIWDVSTCALVCTLTGHTDIVRCVAFSPNGRQLVSGSFDSMVRVWDTGTSASVCALAGHTNSVTCVAFSSNGQQLISGSLDGTVRIWDVSTGVEVQKFTQIDYLNCIALSPNGHQLALASWKGTSSVQVWDVSTREAVHNPATQPSTIDCCAFSPSGLQLATADADGTVWIWDSRTGVPIGSPLCHSDWIASMDYRESQGQLLLVATHWDDWILTVWNMSVTPPSRFYDHVSFLRDPDTPYIPPTSSHSPIDIDRWRKRTFISTAGISFYLPSSFRIPPPRKNYTPYSSHEGRIAYGGKDGSVIIIDCSHLLPNSS